jgi:hypothetical protein
MKKVNKKRNEAAINYLNKENIKILKEAQKEINYLIQNNESK